MSIHIRFSQQTDSDAASWDAAERFQSEHSDKSPSGRTGMEGFRVIRRFLEPHWIISSTPHPLWQRLRQIAYEQNYIWFSRFSKILEALSEIPGSEAVIQRLAGSEYWKALNEVDFALKIHLNGIQCRFISRKKNISTPDLSFDHESRTSYVEITSLNISEQEKIVLETENWLLMEQFKHRCRSGWSIYWDHPDLDFAGISEVIRQTAMEAFTDALASKAYVHRNAPGVFDIHVTPEDRTDRMPKKWAGFSQMSVRTPLPVRDRIARIIDDKVRRQLTAEDSSALVFYDRISSESIRELSNDHSIAVKMETWPNLAAVSLIHPVTNPFAVSNVKSKVEAGWELTAINHTLPNGEAAECLVWENSEEKGHSKTIQLLKECLERYPDNLAQLLRPPHA